MSWMSIIAKKTKTPQKMQRNNQFETKSIVNNKM